MDFSTNLKGFYQMLVLYCLRTVKNLMPRVLSVEFVTKVTDHKYKIFRDIWTRNIKSVTQREVRVAMSARTVGKGRHK